MTYGGGGCQGNHPPDGIMSAMPRRKEVDTWFASYENPMKEVVLAMRDAILAADPRIDECIKWQAPTFTYEGNLASFFPRSKKHASLMFHQGSQIPGTWKRLEGSGVGRHMKVTSLEDLDSARDELARIVRTWCDARESAKVEKPAKQKTAKVKTAKTKTKTKAKAKTKTAKKKPAAKQR
jgi:hypothetical protein